MSIQLIDLIRGMNLLINLAIFLVFGYLSLGTIIRKYDQKYMPSKVSLAIFFGIISLLGLLGSVMFVVGFLGVLDSGVNRAIAVNSFVFMIDLALIGCGISFILIRKGKL